MGIYLTPKMVVMNYNLLTHNVTVSVVVFVPVDVSETDRQTSYNIRTSSGQDFGLEKLLSFDDRIKSRNDHITELCQNHHDWATSSMQGVAYVFQQEKIQVAYCEVPKVGCTFWKRVFRFLNKDYGTQNIVRPNDIPRFYTHMAPFTKTPKIFLNEPHNAQMLSQMQNSIMFSRDPYTRQWSAYLDKFYLPDFWNTFGRTAIITLRRQPTSLSLRCGHNLRFEEYLRYIIGLMRTKSLGDVRTTSVNFHFLPVHEICNPCSMNFTYIGKQETFASDSQNIFKETGISALLGEDLFSNTVEDEIKSLSEYYLTLANMRYKSDPICYNSSLICWKLWHVFQFNGYIGKDVVFPEWMVSHVTDLQQLIKLFVAIALQARASGNEFHDVWMKQRRQSLVDAYRALPSYLLQDFQNTYERDFELFDYEREPSDIYRKDYMYDTR